MADAVGTKIIGLYGPTSPERSAPYYNRGLVISRHKIIDKNVGNIPTQEVIDKMREVLGTG